VKNDFPMTQSKVFNGIHPLSRLLWKHDYSPEEAQGGWWAKLSARGTLVNNKKNREKTQKNKPKKPRGLAQQTHTFLFGPKLGLPFCVKKNEGKQFLLR